MKYYLIDRPHGGLGVRARVETNGGIRPLKHWPAHASTFECNYAGSGPADLALAILVNYFGEHPRLRGERLAEFSPDSRAYALHKRFKNNFIASMPREGGVISSAEIDAWLKKLERP